jgi:hypothetical protein
MPGASDVRFSAARMCTLHKSALSELQFGIKLQSAILRFACNASLMRPLFIHFRDHQMFRLSCNVVIKLSSWKGLTFLQIGNTIHVRSFFENGHQNYIQNKPGSDRDRFVPNDIMPIRH